MRTPSYRHFVSRLIWTAYGLFREIERAKKAKIYFVVCGAIIMLLQSPKSFREADPRRVLVPSPALLQNAAESLRRIPTTFAPAPHFKVHYFQQRCDLVKNTVRISQANRKILNPRKRPRCTIRSTAPATMAVQTLVQNEAFLRFLQGSSLNVCLNILLRVKKQKVLTETGLLHATGLGVLLWTTLGFGGYVLGVSFLVIGSAVTRVGRARKEALGIAEKRGGARGPENLWGAAGVAAICAICCALCRALAKQYIGIGNISKWLSISEQCLKVGFSGAIAAKCADTSSSEIGKAYGTRTFLITSFQEVPSGTEGGVSIEGTTAGFFAALFTGILAYKVGLVHNNGDIILVTLAGNFANLLESVIGADLQAQQKLTNEQVNFVNTMIGAVCGSLLSLVHLVR